MGIFSGHAAHPAFQAIAQHHKGVVIKQLRNDILVIGKIVVVGVFQLAVGGLQFDEQERNAVDKPDDVGAALTLAFALNPELTYGQEVVGAGVQSA